MERDAVLKFAGKKHARAANNKLRLDGRTQDARRHITETVKAERVYERLVRETTKHTLANDKAAEIAEKITHRKAVTRRLAGAIESTGRQVMFADDKDLDALLEDGGPSTILALYENLFRARLCTPLNSFRAFRREYRQPDGFCQKFITQKGAAS